MWLLDKSCPSSLVIRKGVCLVWLTAPFFLLKAPRQTLLRVVSRIPCFWGRGFSRLSLSTQVQGPLSQGLSLARWLSTCRRQPESSSSSPSLSPQSILPSTTSPSSGLKGTRPEEAGSWGNILNTACLCPVPASEQTWVPVQQPFKVADKSHAHSENPNSGSGWTCSFWGSSFTLTFRLSCLQWSFIGPFFSLGQFFLLSSFFPFLLSCFLPFLPPTTPIILLVIPLFLASGKRGVPSTLPSHPRAITGSGSPHHAWSWSHAQADISAWAQSVPVPVPRLVPSAQGWGCPSCWGWGAPPSLQLPCSLVEQWDSPGCQVLPCHPQVTSQHFQSPAAPCPCSALVKDWEKHLCAGKHLNLCLKTFLNWARCLDV